jgi:hypothetical protein
MYACEYVMLLNPTSTRLDQAARLCVHSLQSTTMTRRHSQFRPCIDLHSGVVKQIVGGTLDLTADGEGNAPRENFVAT